ncbi:MAG: hypothetical protein M1832_000957 [Thelocarpon impressellum]|nr:MAG: hypothetical protein M1832_000957 [Thelocarpon impressellum]
MTSPPPQPPQDSIASGKDKVSSGRRLAASQQQQHQTASAAAAPSSAPAQPAARRLVLTPISTTVGSATWGSPSRAGSQASPRTAQPAASTASPFASSFSSVLNSSLRDGAGNRHNSSPASAASPFPSLQSGSQQQLHAGQLLSSPRSRNITPSSQQRPPSSAAASSTTSQPGGAAGPGGVGGQPRGPAFSHSPSYSQSNINSPSSPSSNANAAAAASSGSGSNTNNQAGQLSKIVIAQVFLLLSTIKEDKDKTKWETQADQIRKLVHSNGMEVFSKYFRRLLVGNAPQIFAGINRPVENAGNYPLLAIEVRKVSQDPEQARKIADAIAVPDGDLFRDFDLSTFMEHFKLDPLEKTILALGFKTTTRSDLRTKGKSDAILSNNFQRLLDVLSTSSVAAEKKYADLSPTILMRLIDGLIQHPPPNLNEEGRTRLAYAVRRRYENLEVQMPIEVSSAIQLIGLVDSRQPIVRVLQQAGPHSTSSPEACKALLQSAANLSLDAASVAAALLYMIAAPDWEQFRPSVFVATVQEHGQSQRLDWAKVVRAFDRDGLKIDEPRFLRLYEALEPVAEQDANFDIQMLWGGSWQWPETQLSFITAFVSLPPSVLDASRIPRLRASFDATYFADAADEVQDYATEAATHTLVSLDAMTALFDVIAHSPAFFMSPEGQQIFQNVVQEKTDVFLCSAMGVPKPWNETQQGILARLFYPFLLKQHPKYSFVLHCVWKQDKQWVATRLVEAHASEPLKLPLLLDHSQEHHWLDDLLQILNGFGLDMAALAHRRGVLDLEKWAQGNAQRGPQEFAYALSRFLTIKAEDEMKKAPTPRTVSLAVRTVNTMLEILEDILSDERREEGELVAVQRLCIQAYPRLINYGEGFDDIIDANGEESNAIPEGADTLMQEHYKKMYGGERDVREIVAALQSYKQSRDLGEQDLFACMIHGLFDEYSCFREYPLEALATTAVLFGGIINFNLISGIPLRVGLGMILEAVRDYPIDTSMYKFGLQALLHFFNRLQEWPGFCSFLLQVPGLRGTEPFVKAEEIVRERANQLVRDAQLSREGVPNGVPAQNGFTDGASAQNGSGEGTLEADAGPPRFASIHVDPPSLEGAEDPDEETQDKVLFVLNNVSEQNLEVKLKDLKDALAESHLQWFAGYLVEQRAKVQPNFHKLYLEMLELFKNKILWAEVLRETYVSVIRMLNATSTMESSTERTHLKNLGGWLGSLTIARNKPIKYKNISFKDLLIQGYDTQRLIIIIPFTCKVLAQASKSIVFKPPNPWVMDIIGLLIELYHFAELRLQLKFEIEVLCKDLSLDHNAIQPSTSLRERPHPEDEMSGPALPDGLDAFDDLSITGLSRPGARNERFSPGAITSSLPDIGSLLVYPPTSNTSINRDSLRYIVESAVRKAIQEIISPVVERSVTIAAISTAQLIHKDFAMESSEEKVRQSALTMVKALAGSLALVTCKEPLRMSMTNYIRVLSAEGADQALPEGAILMCVNDNLDTACSMVESAAEQRSMPEIEENIEQQLLARRRHRTARPNEPFVDPIVNRWSFYIPEPYKQSPNGLNKEQMAIYEDFVRQSRGPPTHTNASSTDSGRQIVNEVLQEQYPSIPNLPTPAEPPAIPHQAPLQPQQPQQQAPQQQQPQQRMQPSSLVPAHVSQTAQLNGYADAKSANEQINDHLSELLHAAKEAPQERLKDLTPTDTALEIPLQILRLVLVSTQREDVAYLTAKKIYHILYTELEKPLEIEIFVQLLKRLCDLSPVTAREVTVKLASQDDEQALNLPVTIGLLKAHLLDLQRVDQAISGLIQQRSPTALNFLAHLMDEILFSKRPFALRADFANSLEAIAQWVAEQPDVPVAKLLLRKLRESGVPEVLEAIPDERSRQHHDQMEYAFQEWVRLCSRGSTTDKTFAAFISQLHQKQLMNNQDDSCLFFRICIDLSVDAFEEHEAGAAGGLGEAFICIDALAKLVVLLVRYQGEAKGEVKRSKAAYLNSILSLIVLVLNHHHVMRGERFNQKVFFRLFSSILCEHHAVRPLFMDAEQFQEKEMLLVIGNAFLTLQPAYFPGFVFGWLALISHRFFMPAMLLLHEQAVSDEAHEDGSFMLTHRQGWETYTAIMEAMLSFVGELMKPLVIDGNSKDVYRGTLRILLVLHHDFPEFLAENHYRLCGAIPAHCTQLRNLILSAYPSSFPELPDPFTAGLKVDRINEIRTSPAVAGDFEGPIRQAGVKEAIDASLAAGNTEEHVSAIAGAIYSPPSPETGVGFAPVRVDLAVLTSLVLYVGTSAIAMVGQKGGPTFVSTSPQADLLNKLARELNAEARYYFLGAIANQLRYPNSHTHYFSYALLFMFGSDQNDQEESDVRQQITRVLLERLIVHRPHPWGLIITLLELLKNPAYLFWELPFIKAAPEIERLFGALFQHINQSPR